MTKYDIEYNKEFGDIPDTVEGRIEYIKNGKKVNKSLEDHLAVCIKRIKRIRYKKIEFTFYRIIRPSARPRATAARGFISLYVPRAADNAKWFESWYNDNDLPRITTPCSISIKIFEKTPGGFSVKDKILAEMGFLRPWKRTGDIDNYCKSILDMMQHGMLEDDYLVIESKQELFYSIKPRAEISVKYMNKFPEEVIRK